ncbi:MAG: hypothetical protein HON55_02945 [Legionellales bacterium]|jgi:hypothetical protein|nr:hypothetical protein [Legionellales bacterium]
MNLIKCVNPAWNDLLGSTHQKMDCDVAVLLAMMGWGILDIDCMPAYSLDFNKIIGLTANLRHCDEYIAPAAKQG